MKRIIVWDSDRRGFGLRIGPNGEPAFVVIYRDAGRQRLFTLEETDADLARIAANRIRAAIDNDADYNPQAEREEVRRQRAGTHTVAELATEWLKRRAHRKAKNSMKNDRAIIGAYLAPQALPKASRRSPAPFAHAFGNLPLHHVTTERVEELRLWIGLGEVDAAGNVIRKAKPYQANRTVELLRAMYTLAGQGSKKIKPPLKWLPAGSVNPCHDVGRFKETLRERILSEEDAGRLFDWLEANATAAVTRAVKLLLLTGARAQEVLGARWDEFTFGRQPEWRKPAERTKSGEPKINRLGDDVVAILLAMR